MIGLTDAIALFRKLDSLLQLEKVHGDAIAEIRQALGKIDSRLQRLERRAQRTEDREDVVVNEAKAAARAGAQDAMSGYMADIVRRITLLEAGVSGTPAPAKRVRKAKGDSQA